MRSGRVLSFPEALKMWWKGGRVFSKATRYFIRGKVPFLVLPNPVFSTSNEIYHISIYLPTPLSLIYHHLVHLQPFYSIRVFQFVFYVLLSGIRRFRSLFLPFSFPRKIFQNFLSKENIITWLPLYRIFSIERDEKWKFLSL